MTMLGFGFTPSENKHHMLVNIPKKPDGFVNIYERFSWHDTDSQTLNLYDEDKAKAEISKHKWKQIEPILRVTFNERLKKQKLPLGKFIIGQTPMDILFGKELLVLFWAIEDADPANIPMAIRNWLGLAPEERWWLYTMTNAAAGGLYDRSGWRKALRYALCENPIDESRQLSLFDAMLKRTEEG